MGQSRRWVAIIFVASLSLAHAACGADDASSGSPKNKSGGSGAGATAGAGAFGNAVDTGTAGTFVPVDVAPTGGDCKAGHYVGKFNGIYRSAAWGNGTSTLMVAASDSMGMPGLEFWLEQAAEPVCDTEGEFCAEFEVSGGKMRGFANPFSSGDPSDPANDPNNPASLFAIKVPFNIDLNGALDCTNGKIKLTLDNGQYDVATIIYHFSGTADGDYDASKYAIVNGTWQVKEEQMPGAIWPADANIGGEGTWEAALVP